MATVAMRSPGRGISSDSNALDNELCRFDGNGGQKIQRCLDIKVDDAGNMGMAGYMVAASFYGTVFDTNVAAAGLVMSGTTIAADGTDANIDINVTPKGTGALRVAGNSIFQNPANSLTAYQWLQAAGGTPVMNIDTTNGRVGIGTETPDATLQISSSDPTLRITDTDTNADLIISAISGVGGAIIGADANNEVANSYLAFRLDGIERMRINEGGNVGIGTTNPGSKVHIIAGAIATMLELATNETNLTSKYGGLTVSHYDNSEEPFVTIFGGSSAGTQNYIRFGGGSSTANSATSIEFFTAADTTTVTGTERMRIDKYGNVGINEVSPETLVEMTSTVPYWTSHNSTEENIEGGRECIWRAKGEKGDGTEHTLGEMQFSHDGTGDDYKADFILSVNQNGGADTLVEALRIDSSSLITTTGVIRGATSLWWHVLHNEIASANPGGSGAVWMDVDANTLGGWQLDASTEILEVESGLHSDYDGASDVEIKVIFEVNVDNTGGNVTDTVDLVCEAFYKGTGDTATKTQTQEEAVVVGQAAQYTMFTCTFLLNWDETDNVIEAGDKLHCHFNLETDTSEVDDIIVNHIHTRYKTKQVKAEV